MRRRAFALTVLAGIIAGLHTMALAENPELLMPRDDTDPVLLGIGADGGALDGTHIQPVMPTVRTTASDVSREHWTVPTEADAMAGQLLGAAEDGKFHAARFVTRKELSEASSRLLAKAAHAWPDRVREPKAPERDAFSTTDSGELATRADLARALAGVLCNLRPAAQRLEDAMVRGNEIFYDIPEGDPRFGVIVAARDLGLVRGYHDGGYHPAEPVLRMELAESLVWTWRYLSTLPDPTPSMVSPSEEQPTETAGDENEGSSVRPREHWTADPAMDEDEPSESEPTNEGEHEESDEPTVTPLTAP